MTTIKRQPKQPDSLASLQKTLALVDFETYLLPKSPENPFEQLLVAVDENLLIEEGQEAQFVLQLFYTNDLSQPAAGESNPDDLQVLQFYIALPTVVPQAKLLAAFQFASFFTQVVPLGAFHITAQNQVFYRYCLMTDNRSVDSHTVVEVVELISFFVNCFHRQLLTLVNQDKSLETLIQATQAELSDSLR